MSGDAGASSTSETCLHPGTVEGFTEKVLLVGSGEQAQRVTAQAALAEDPGSVPSPNMMVTTVCNSNSSRPYALF